MKKILPFLLPVLLFTGCTTTFAGTLFYVNLGDIILYVIIALVLAFFIALLSTNRKRAFWIWFILSLVITPLAGLIYLLIKLTNRNKKTDR